MNFRVVIFLFSDTVSPANTTANQQSGK